VKMTDYTFIDTDIQIHGLSPDPPVRAAVEHELNSSKPIAMSEFSLVELKGNYIQDLVLLRRKVCDSTSLELAFSRVQNTGGRRAALMLAQLIKWLGGSAFPVNPWAKARSLLLTHLDAQVLACWKEFQRKTDKVFADFECARAKEGPLHIREGWHVAIPKCSPQNSKCKINEFMMKFSSEIQALASYIDSLDAKDCTNELLVISNIIKKTLRDGVFHIEGQACRKIGDLLIGLQSKSGKELLSSNYKEHSQLHKPLSYNFRQFPIANIRSK